MSILSLLFTCCNENDSGNSNLNDTVNFTVKYSRNSSWIDYNYEATINSNGLLKIVEDVSLTNSSRQSSYQVSQSEMNLIEKLLIDVKCIDMNDRYGFDNENAPTDLPVTSLKYYSSEISDSTIIYFPKNNELPLALDTFLTIVEQVVLENDTVKWQQ